MATGRPARGDELDTERFDPLVFLREAGVEIAVVIGAGRCGAVLRRLDEPSGTIQLQSPISRSEIDPDAHKDGGGSGVIVFGGLLSAVAHAVDAGPFDELRIGRVELDLGDVRTRLGRR